MGSNPGLLLLRHWQSDALTSRLDLIRIFNMVEKNVVRISGSEWIYISVVFIFPKNRSKGTVANILAMNAIDRRCFVIVTIQKSVLWIRIRLLISMPIVPRTSSFTSVGKSEFCFAFIHRSGSLYCYIFLCGVTGVIIINIVDSKLEKYYLALHYICWNGSGSAGPRCRSDRILIS